MSNYRVRTSTLTHTPAGYEYVSYYYSGGYAAGGTIRGTYESNPELIRGCEFKIPESVLHTVEALKQTPTARRTQ